MAGPAVCWYGVAGIIISWMYGSAGWWSRTLSVRCAYKCQDRFCRLPLAGTTGGNIRAGENVTDRCRHLYADVVSQNINKPVELRASLIIIAPVLVTCAM